MRIRSYSELVGLPTFEERFDYLKLNGVVGSETFGFDRYFNQKFYHSAEWKRLRRQIILRDNGCDLGVDGYEIPRDICIHHMNPVLLKDIETKSEYLLNPDFLICTSRNTHRAIHYGTEELLPKLPKERSANDTCPWR